MPSNMPKMIEPSIIAPAAGTPPVTPLPDPLPDVILDALSELYWDERINHPAIAALRA